MMEQWVMIDAAKRASAKRITAVCPRYGYGRQDRKSRGREPITARMVADFFGAAGAERIMSVDLHSGQVQGFFDGPVDHLTAVNLLVDYIKANVTGDLVMVSPDTGRTKVAEKAARNAGDIDMASVYKRRSVDLVGHVEALDVMGDVRGRMCVLIDDEIDTAGTLCEAAKILAQKGATEVWATATHGVFSEPAIDRLKNSNIVPGRGHRHRPPAAREADPQDRERFRGQDLRRRHPGRLRGGFGVADLRGRQPELDVAPGLGAWPAPRPRLVRPAPQPLLLGLPSPQSHLAGYQLVSGARANMAEVKLVAELGRTTGSSASRRLRVSGRIPAVVYGHGMQPLPVSVGARDLGAALSSHGLNQVLELEVEGTSHLVLARQLQRHPVRRTVAHVDFQVVRRDEVVQAEVPVVVVGVAANVERDRGVLEQLLTSLSIRTTPERIPQEITLDVSALEVGQALRVRDLVLPEGVTTDLDPEEPVVIAALSRTAAEMEAAEEAEAPEAASPAEPGAAGTAGAPAAEEG